MTQFQVGRKWVLVAVQAAVVALAAVMVSQGIQGYVPPWMLVALAVTTLALCVAALFPAPHAERGDA